jgi:hypothetical protein
MKWFKSRVKQLREEVDAIKAEIGKDKPTSWYSMWPSLWGFGDSPYKTIKQRLDALEDENALLREYLGIEKHTTEKRTGFRKIAKGKQLHTTKE